MVKRNKKEDSFVYLCDECGLGYENGVTAQKCEEHCKKHNSCSLEITKYAIIK